MRAAKEVALAGVYTALMIGAQFALGWVAGIELVTALFSAFALYFGARRALLVANAFSLLRCFVFGFFPAVIILYLIYYNIFAIVFALIGGRLGRKITPRKLAVTVLAAAVMTIFFTALDDVITPLYFGYTLKAARAYAVASLAALIPQVVCAVVSVAVLTPALTRIFSCLNFADSRKKPNPAEKTPARADE